MKVGIVLVPYVSSDRHLELAIETIKSFSSIDNELSFYLVCNKLRDDRDKELILAECSHKTNLPIYFEDNDKNCLSRGWNKGIDKALADGCDYIFLPNLDLILSPDCIDNLVSGAVKNPQAILWCASNYPDKENIYSVILDEGYSEQLDGNSFSYFLINKRLIDTVGYFDELFVPAYFEDNDMVRRIQLSGNTFCTVYNALAYHYGSQTIKNDSQLAMQNNETFQLNQRRYIEKWGGMPGIEEYSSPYNQ